MSILIENVSKKFGEKTVLDNINLEIKSGSLVALLGSSGSGKSTLLRVVAGFEQPDTGRIWLHGKNSSNFSVQEKEIGFVFQAYALFKHLTVYENIAFNLKDQSSSSIFRFKTLFPFFSSGFLANPTGKNPDEKEKLEKEKDNSTFVGRAQTARSENNGLNEIGPQPFSHINYTLKSKTNPSNPLGVWFKTTSMESPSLSSSDFLSFDQKDIKEGNESLSNFSSGGSLISPSSLISKEKFVPPKEKSFESKLSSSPGFTPPELFDPEETAHLVPSKSPKPRSHTQILRKTKERSNVEELLRIVQLEEFANRYPSQLSGGQCQRVALARALAVQPKVLLLDEPFGALDMKVRKQLRRWLRKLHEKVGVTTIFVTHDHQEAMEVANEIVVLENGRVKHSLQSPQKIYNRLGVNKFNGLPESRTRN